MWCTEPITAQACSFPTWQRYNKIKWDERTIMSLWEWREKNNNPGYHDERNIFSCQRKSCIDNSSHGYCIVLNISSIYFYSIFLSHKVASHSITYAGSIHKILILLIYKVRLLLIFFRWGKGKGGSIYLFRLINFYIVKYFQCHVFMQCYFLSLSFIDILFVCLYFSVIPSILNCVVLLHETW